MNNNSTGRTDTDCPAFFCCHSLIIKYCYISNPDNIIVYILTDIKHPPWLQRKCFLKGREPSFLKTVIAQLMKEKTAQWQHFSTWLWYPTCQVTTMATSFNKCDQNKIITSWQLWGQRHHPLANYAKGHSEKEYLKSNNVHAILLYGYHIL